MYQLGGFIINKVKDSTSKIIDFLVLILISQLKIYVAHYDKALNFQDIDLHNLDKPKCCHCAQIWQHKNTSQPMQQERTYEVIQTQHLLYRLTFYNSHLHRVLFICQKSLIICWNLYPFFLQFSL